VSAHDGVLLVRDDGVIEVREAMPWPSALARQIERTMAAVLGQRGEDEQQRTEEER